MDATSALTLKPTSTQTTIQGVTPEGIPAVIPAGTTVLVATPVMTAEELAAAQILNEQQALQNMQMAQVSSNAMNQQAQPPEQLAFEAGYNAETKRIAEQNAQRKLQQAFEAGKVLAKQMATQIPQNLSSFNNSG